jgi:hypothetical protein
MPPALTGSPRQGLPLAFALKAGYDHEDPGNTHFGSIGSQRYPDGHIVYMPDIAGTPSEAVVHWSARSRAHFVLEIALR